jgi:hypothetical protein
LSDRDLAAHDGELLAAGGRSLSIRVRQTLFEEIIAPRDEEVAEQKRSGAPEPSRVADPPSCPMGGLEGAMGGGTATASVGVVDDVVVHERSGVEDLESGCRSEHVIRGGEGGAGILADGSPPREAEPRAKSLAAAHGVGGCLVQQDRFVPEQCRLGFPDREEVLDSLGNCRNRITTY